MIISNANEKQFFSYELFDPVLSVNLMDEHHRGGFLNIGDFGVDDEPEINANKMSFVVELVATDEFPESPLDEDQVWFKESSKALLKSVRGISGSIRIRELNRLERKLIDSYKKNPQSKSGVSPKNLNDETNLCDGLVTQINFLINLLVKRLRFSPRMTSLAIAMTRHSPRSAY